MNYVKFYLGARPVILILFLVVFSVSLGRSSQYQRKADKSTILYLFQNQGFKQLNSKLEEFQKEYEEDYQGEDNVYDVFEVFKNVDPAYEPILNIWVKQFGVSFAPYVARAKYYCACAVQARGNKWVIEKEGKEFKEMEKYYSLALLDIAEALKINVRLDVCYTMKIEIGMALDNDELKNNALNEAVKYHPYTYRVRLNFVQTLVPRQGGSYQKMQEYIDSCSKYIVFNPKIGELSASIPADKGRSFYSTGKYENAVKMYTEALKYSVHHSYYAERGNAYARLKDYRNALADYEHALKLSPNDPEYLNRKSYVVDASKRISQSRRMRNQTEKSDEYDDWPQNQSLKSVDKQAYEHAQKGSNLMRAGRYEEAVKELNESIRLSPDNYVSYYNRAQCYLQLRNEDAALQDLLQVVARKHDEIDAHVKIMTIYANRGMYDDALNSISTAASLNPQNAEVLYYRAKIHQAKGMNVEALEDMRQACDMGYQRACRDYKQVK